MKEDTTLVQRYADLSNSSGIAAGVYSGTLAITFTTKFNIIVNLIGLSIYCNDSVTLQAIEAQGYIKVGSPTNQGNPAIEPTFGITVQPTLVFHAGYYCERRMWVEMGASDSWTVASTVFFSVVTANSINRFYNLTIGYLAPEDYLSIDAFAAIPG